MRMLRDSVAEVTMDLKKHKKIRGKRPLCVPPPCGDVILKLNMSWAQIFSMTEFPSPCGDMVLKFVELKDWLSDELFPSPCGDVVLKSVDYSP